jgi:molybdopterin-guanine dinucleotide biosynthesis protein A
VLDDATEVRAPIAGVVAGLRASKTDVSVVLPVDTPLMTPELLLALADACVDAASTQTGPLPAALRKTALPVLERRLAAGQLALRAALDELDTRIVDADPELLQNVNRPDELRRLR